MPLGPAVGGEAALGLGAREPSAALALGAAGLLGRSIGRTEGTLSPSEVRRFQIDVQD